MAECCGGKNAGKPISLPRYLAGLSVFLGYHGAMRVLLAGASVPFPALRKVRDFHGKVFKTDLGEILRLEDINLNGRFNDTSEQVCAVSFRDGVRTVEIDGAAHAAPQIPLS
jgi:hypothetical protein